MIQTAIGRFGVTEGALVRMALEDFMPRYLGENKEFLAKVAAAIESEPTVREQIERLLRKTTRSKRAA